MRRSLPENCSMGLFCHRLEAQHVRWRHADQESGDRFGQVAELHDPPAPRTSKMKRKTVKTAKIEGASDQ